MTYNKNIPQATDDLSVSQGEVQANFLQLNTSFEIDHYTFDDVSGDTGKHRTITTVDQVTDPTTAAVEPRIYGKGTFTPSLVLQYSRGESDAVPTPLTSAHGDLVLPAATTTDLFDFTGITTGLVEVYLWNVAGPGTQISGHIIISGGVLNTTGLASTATALTFSVAGSVLNVRHQTGITTKWTLDFKRLA